MAESGGVGGEGAAGGIDGGDLAAGIPDDVQGGGEGIGGGCAGGRSGGGEERRAGTAARGIDAARERVGEGEDFGAFDRQAGRERGESAGGGIGQQVRVEEGVLEACRVG